MLIIKKDILSLGKGTTQGLDDTTTTAEAEYSIDFTEQGKKFCLFYITVEVTAIYLLMLQEYINSKQKILK